MKLAVAIFFVVVAVCSADVSHLKDEPIPILKQFSDVRTDGYQWDFQTGNGIDANEQGQLKNIGTEQEAISVQGAASWTAPDGSPVSFRYIADETGYHPEGEHIPTPPPIPEAIIKALEWIKAHPEPETRKQ